MTAVAVAPPSMREMVDEMLALSGQLDADLAALRTAGVAYAHADDAYRLAKAKKYLAVDGTIPEREAQVDVACEQERLEQRLADAEQYACREVVKTRRAQLSAWQSIANAVKAEIDMARSGPQ